MLNPTLERPAAAIPVVPAATRPARRLPQSWPYLVPALVLAVVYGRTVQRGTGNAFSLDTTKFELVGLVLGTPHPPGYPLYTMLNSLVVRLVPVGSPALLANLLSAVFALLTCVVAVSVLRSLGLSRVLAAGGATALGMLPALWRNAVVAEVYSLSALFLVAVLACVLRYERSRRPGWLRAALLLFALSFAHAPTSVLLVPGLLLHLLVRRPAWLVRPRELVTLLPAGALLALVPYAYLPWRTAVDGNTWLETRVHDAHSLWAALTGAQFGNRMFQVPLPVIRSERLPDLAAAALGELGPLLVLAAVGLVVLALSRPAVAALTVGWALATAGFVLSYAVDDWLTLLLPLWLLVALWALVGLDRCLDRFCAPSPRRARAVTAAVSVALVLAAFVHGLPQADRSGPDPQEQVDAAVARLPDSSIVFTGTLEARQQFAYRLLPDDLGLRRSIWAAEGPVRTADPGQSVHHLRSYCAPDPGPWTWPWHEQPASAIVPRGLQTFAYGADYAAEVRRQGLAVTPVADQLFAVACPSSPRPRDGDLRAAPR